QLLPDFQCTVLGHEQDIGRKTAGVNIAVCGKGIHFQANFAEAGKRSWDVECGCDEEASGGILVQPGENARDFQGGFSGVARVAFDDDVVRRDTHHYHGSLEVLSFPFADIQQSAAAASHQDTTYLPQFVQL